ncbi:MAG: oligoribonuclease, partial [Psychrobacillus psychrodurans]
LEKNKAEIGQTFTSFEEGERFLKRNYEAALVRDDLFVDYLMSEVKKRDNS